MSIPLGKASATAVVPEPAASEIVHRPEPGLARGAWEAPAWFFYAALTVVVILGVGYALARLGVGPFGALGRRRETKR